jgi:general stress protein 26
MKDREPLKAFRALLDSVRVGLLCTVGTDGAPHVRWMTAATLPGEHRFLYCVTGSGSVKVADLEKNDRVQWSFQSASLDEVVSLEGRALVLDNPELKAQVLEQLGSDLQAFWRVQPDPKRLVVIETEIINARLYRPMENISVLEEARQ